MRSSTPSMKEVPPEVWMTGQAEKLRERTDRFLSARAMRRVSYEEDRLLGPANQLHGRFYGGCHSRSARRRRYVSGGSGAATLSLPWIDVSRIFDEAQDPAFRFE